MLKSFLRILLVITWINSIIPSCVDRNKYSCVNWARSGQCQLNPSYMKVNCKRSCGLCPVPSCVDGNKYYCANWARSGQCQLNPSYMKVNCKRSCGLCPAVRTSTTRRRRATTKAPAIRRRRVTTKAPVIRRRRATTKAPAIRRRRATTKAPVIRRRRATTKAPVIRRRRATTKTPVIRRQTATTKAPVARSPRVTTTKKTIVAGPIGKGTPVQDECVDKDKRCTEWKEKFCEDLKYKPFMNKNCKKSCGFCVTPPPPTKQKQSSCGMNRKSAIKRFIVGGVNADPHAWAWQARMDIEGSPGKTCGGTLITPNVVLTAAHCVVIWNVYYGKFKDKFQKKNMVITLGDHKRKSNDGKEQEFGVFDFVYHEDYVEKGYLNDIALIMLNKTATLNEYVNVVCLPDENKDVDLNSECYITGWGKTIGTDEESLSNVLQEAKLPIVEKSECNRRNNAKITDKMICAGTKRGTTSGCQGDSGGPFVCRSNNKWFVQGIVSWGHVSCENKKKYTVFTRTSKYVKWIQDKLK